MVKFFQEVHRRVGMQNNQAKKNFQPQLCHGKKRAGEEIAELEQEGDKKFWLP